MKECRYCRKPLKDEDAFCTSCGYNPKTDTIDQSFKQQIDSITKSQLKEKNATDTGGGIDPRVKKFAYVGIAIVMLSIFYKYNFNINVVRLKMSRIIAGIKTGKFVKGKADKKKDNKVEEIEFIDISSFKAPKKTTGYKDLAVEGIFFDPDTKSFVIINGEVVSEGETLGNVTIKKISKDSVELIVDGETKILEANQNIPSP